MAKDEARQVVVNARFVTQPITGVQRFAIEICRQLKQIYPAIRFVSPRNIRQKAIADELEVEPFGYFTSHVWEQLELLHYLHKLDSPVLVNLCNTAPLYFTRNITCIHDLAFAVNPKWFSKAFVSLYSFLIPRVARKSLQVITVSKYSKAEIVKYIGIPETKVTVVYNSIAHVFLKQQHTDHKYNSYGNYLLAVSSIDPRKNLISLVQAFKRVKIRDLNLVIVGAESKVFGDPHLKEEIINCSSIFFTGYLPDDKLANLYKQACLFIYPSLYEGFGIPPLEAMAFGCPTIVSNQASLPEICGDASLYVEPLDVNSLQEKIESLYANLDLQQQLRAKGYNQIKLYSWQRSAEQVARLIQQYR